MNGLFNYDGSVIHALNKVADCVILSVFWLVSSIFIVTIGASTTALYYAMNKCVRRGEGHISREYWRAFASNFKQATLLWLPLLAVYALLGASLYSSYIMCVSGNLSKGMFYFLIVVIALVLTWASWLFPYMARFSNTIKNTVKNSSLIALFNMPVTLLQLVFLVAAVAAIGIFPLVILCAPGLYMIGACCTMEPVFLKYMTPEDRKKEEELMKAHQPKK